MVRCDLLMREGKDALVAHHFRDAPLASPYTKGTKRHFWWSRGVERAREKISELNQIGR